MNISKGGRTGKIINQDDVFDPADVQVDEAKLVTPSILAKILKNNKNCILVTGGKLIEDEILADLVFEIIKKSKIDVIATGGSSKPLIERGLKVHTIPLHILIQYLEDFEYNKIDNRKSCKLPKALIDNTNAKSTLNSNKPTLIFLGFETYFLSRMLSSLKHFTKIVTINIDPFYQPHAKLSFPNSFDNRFIELLISLM